MEERNGQVKKGGSHNVIIDNREKAIITGVIDIHSFDDELVLAETDMGIITIKGINLKMNKLNIDSNELSLEGMISSFTYSDTAQMKKSSGTGMFNKLFK